MRRKKRTKSFPVVFHECLATTLVSVLTPILRVELYGTVPEARLPEA